MTFRVCFCNSRMKDGVCWILLDGSIIMSHSQETSGQIKFSHTVKNYLKKTYRCWDRVPYRLTFYDISVWSQCRTGYNFKVSIRYYIRAHLQCFRRSIVSNSILASALFSSDLLTHKFLFLSFPLSHFLSPLSLFWNDQYTAALLIRMWWFMMWSAFFLSSVAVVESKRGFAWFCSSSFVQLAATVPPPRV